MKPNRSVLFALVLALILQPASAQAPADRRPVTVQDLAELKQVSDPQLSPDGQWVAYIVNSPSLKDDKNDSRIWMVSIGGGESIPLTAEGVSSSHPRWSPDGKFIAFLSARNEGKAQVWLLDRRGGEAQKLTDTPEDVDDFVWSPDSRRLVLVLRDPTPDELESGKEKAREEEKEPEKPSRKPKTAKPFLIDRLQFKEDVTGYLDHRRTHLYVFERSAKSLNQITSGDYDDSEPAWSPDGKLIAFTSNRSRPDPDRNYNQDIWVVDAANSDRGARLTQVTTNPGTDRSPAWSPDGKWIAYVSQIEPQLFEYATKHLAVSPSQGGPPKVLTLPAAAPTGARTGPSALDINVDQPRFARNGSIYFIGDSDGALRLYVVNRENQTPALLDSLDAEARGREVLRTVNGYSLASDSSGAVVAQLSSPDRPDEIFSIVNGSYTQLSHVHDALFRKLKLSPAEYVHFQSQDGTTIAGYLYRPVDYAPGKRYPAILRPHGGPVWAYYSEFQPDAQLFAATGYAVLLPNPRGSTGYGQKFAEAIFADWGNKDFQDDMAMVDYAVRQGVADPEKLGVGGWSYGGISTDFIIAQTTRFKAAISGAGEALNTSLYGHDQYQKDYETELGLPWEHKSLWDKLSPFYRVKNITTPTLFMGGEIDWNVPVLGGEQMYQALRRLGVPTQLAVYPGEYHEFTIPSHIRDRYLRYLAWYGHYVKGDSGAPTLPQDTSMLGTTQKPRSAPAQEP